MSSFIHKYCIVFLAGVVHLKLEKKNVQILQNKVLRIINKTFRKNKIMNNTLYYKYKFLKIDDIYKYEVGKFMYLNGIKAFPQIIENYFLSLDLAHNYTARSKCNKNYFLDFVRTNFGKIYLSLKGSNFGIK